MESVTMKNIHKSLIAILFAVFGIGYTSAQPAPDPKGFALLVGVDQYAQPPKGPAISNLKGPANDVAEIKALLLDKYGFSATGQEIVTLIGKQATAAAIESTFKSHLLENAKKHPGTKILFYFSGHGSQTTDKNGDEGDNVDETLVAYDSRLPEKKDIVDDAIESWLQALAPYTNNVTVIFDSCHSGDATKDIDIQARGLPPNPNTDPNGVHVVRAKGVVEKNGLLSSTGSYSFISGSLPGELSNEGTVLDEKGKGATRGFMTHYLVTALRQDPTLTYERAVRQFGPEVTQRAPSQHPHAYGNVLISFLGRAQEREQPYIKITAQHGKLLTIGAGEIQGIGLGTLFAVYSGKSMQLIGESGKIANARATKVSLSTTEVEVLGSPVPVVSLDDKVVVVTPSTVRYRLPVLMGELPLMQTLPNDKKVLAGIREVLKDNHLIQQANLTNWALAVQRGCVTAAGFVPVSKAGSVPKQECKTAYYVAPRDNRNRALADLVVSDTAPNKVAERLASYLALKARQDNLKMLDNLQSPLKGKVNVSLVRTIIKNGVASEQEVPPTTVPKLVPGDKFEIKIANNSDKDLFVAVLVLGTSGATRLFSMSNNGDLIKSHTTVKAKPYLLAGPPYGLESYKVFITTRNDVDYRVLESMGSKTGGGNSAFGMLLSDYSNADTKDAVPPPDLDLDQWTTKLVEAEIVK
jgi:hypothetical protein